MRDASFRPPVELGGRWVRLVPLRPEHAGPLARALPPLDDIRYLGLRPGRTPTEMAQHIAELLRRQAEGTDLPFALVRTSDGGVVGATRYLKIDRPNDAVEIGGSWLDRAVWRTPVNTESKFLLLRHAFETERAVRVALQTDLRNERSQRAIARLGALREGIIRADRLTGDDYRRSSVVYSILTDEWPRVQRRLTEFLARPWAGAPDARPPTA